MPKNISGNNKANTLYGTSDADHLYGYGGDDTLIGGEGGDALDGGEGADTMKGGTGDDDYIVDNFDDTIIEYANEGRDTVHTTVNYGLGDNIEVLIMEGTANIDGYGNASNNDMYGNSGNNHLYGRGGDDMLFGGTGNDHLFGGDGNDTLIGGEGADMLYGGRDNDTYYVDGNDTITELAGMGWDTVYSSVSHVLEANVEALVLEGKANIDGAGNELDNILTGNSGNNMLFGYAGADTLISGVKNDSDTLFGGEGDDTYYVENDLDHVIEHAGGGKDTVFASGNYTMTNNVEILALTGNAVMGFGNSSGNMIIGTDGSNYLDGRAGADNLTGGGGRDTFVFRAGEGNGDVIMDFNGNGAALGDVMEFQGYGPGATFQQINATEWLISSADGSIQDHITLLNGASVDASDWHFA